MRLMVRGLGWVVGAVVLVGCSNEVPPSTAAHGVAQRPHTTCRARGGQHWGFCPNLEVTDVRCRLDGLSYGDEPLDPSLGWDMPPVTEEACSKLTRRGKEPDLSRCQRFAEMEGHDATQFGRPNMARWPSEWTGFAATYWARSGVHFSAFAVRTPRGPVLVFQTVPDGGGIRIVRELTDAEWAKIEDAASALVVRPWGMDEALSIEVQVDDCLLHAHAEIWKEGVFLSGGGKDAHDEPSSTAFAKLLGTLAGCEPGEDPP